MKLNFLSESCGIWNVRESAGRSAAATSKVFSDTATLRTTFSENRIGLQAEKSAGSGTVGSTGRFFGVLPGSR